MGAALWSWKAEQRATRGHIRYFVAEALERKAWAATMPDDWQASDVSREMLADIRAKTVRQLARHFMDYWRHRAFMRGAFAGHPGDRIARDLWVSLSIAVPK